jgi:TRAP-type C4-dicarboxylate transport system substrate-binding protein
MDEALRGGGREGFRRPDQKGEVYPASQLGSIPRQIEGTQFGSIQGWIGPPEFLVGVDERYEALSAPGLFASREQDVRVINDPPVNDMMLGLGARTRA